MDNLRTARAKTNSPRVGARVALALIVLAALPASVASASTSERDASTIILRQADFRGWTYDSSTSIQEGLKQWFGAAGVHGNTAEYTAIGTSKPSGLLTVGGNVFVLQSVAQARKAFPIVKRWWYKALKIDPGDDLVVLGRSSLPKLGDQQYAHYDPAGNEGISNTLLIVRKNATVWVLHGSLSRMSKIPTQAEMLGTTRKFGLLQKTRVGRG
jgi:hypothetical protein